MKNTILKVLSYVLVALVACGMTLMLTQPEQVTPGLQTPSKLEELKDLINDRFIGEVDEDVLDDAAANAMIQALGDRWSYYMTAEDYSNHLDQMANSYVGIGISVQLREDGQGITVTQVATGGPAEEAGVLAGDIITAVNDQTIGGMALADITPLIKGEEGTTVDLTLTRGEESLELTVQRRRIETVVASGTMLEGNVGLVKITNFDSRCADETIAVIEDLMKQGAEALIFDVRYNPGGYKRELVKLLDYLLPEGLLFRSEYYDGTTDEDRSDAACLNIPMAVLINGSSYSAAEFFAAALSEYDYAVTVGTQTCGKGYFQTSFRLSDGSAVNLSVGKYYTPNGVSLAEVGGLTPDVVKEVSQEIEVAIYAGTIDPMEEPQILAAMDALKEK